MAKNEKDGESPSSPMLISTGTIKKSHSSSHGHSHLGHHHHHHRHQHNSSGCASRHESTDSLNSSSTISTRDEDDSTKDSNNLSCPAHGLPNKIRSYQQRQQQGHRSHQGDHYQASSHGNHRQNVAIATQVISPSAIGGSLKLSGPRRLCQHYDPEADIDDSDGTRLFGRTRSLPWGKLSCYGASIGLILLVMTGVVLAVGYMQSEKQRLMSQSQKLSQEWNNSSNSSVFPIPTTWRPKIAYTRPQNITDPETSASSYSHILTSIPLNSTSEGNNSSENIEDSNIEVAAEARNDEIKSNEAVKTEETASQEDSDESDEDDDDEDDDDMELEIYEPQMNKEQSRTQESRDSEQTLSERTRAMPRMDNNGLLLPLPLPPPIQPLQPILSVEVDNTKTEDEERHKSPSEVKVLPPKDFKFNGYSFEIPIYATNASVSPSDEENANQVSNKGNPPSFPFSDPIFPIPKSTAAPAETQDSTSSIQLPKFDIIGIPLVTSLHNSSGTTITNNPYIDLTAGFNYTNNIQSNSDTNPTTSSENDFEALKKFLNTFKSTDTSDDDSNANISQLPPPTVPVTATGTNSFNTGISSVSNLQTDLFSDDDDDVNDVSPNAKSDSDDDHDSEMSASSNGRMGGRNPRPNKIKSQSSDNMYTPRPGSNPHYPDRPARVYSSKTPGTNYYIHSNKNNGVYSQPKNDATNYNQNSNSDYASYELASPSATSTSSTPIKPSTEITPGSASSKSSSTTKFQPYESNSISNLDTDKGKHETTTISTITVNEYSFPIHNANPVTLSPYSSGSTDSSNFHFDFSQLTTPSPPLQGATPTPHFPDVLSKRTFNFGNDYSSGGYGGGSTSNFNTNNNNYNNNNPFSDILGSQSSITGAIGSANPTGATLGYNGNFNFDSFNPYVNTGSTGGSNSHLPSGTIPLDLASSYIQAGNPGSGSSRGGGGNNNPGGFNLHASGSSALNNYDFSSPYGSSPGSSPISLSQLIQNSADHGTRSTGFSSFGPLTTGSGQVPQYNTITQGIHLLSLLHGNIPDHLSDNQPSASNNYNIQAAPPNNYGQQQYNAPPNNNNYGGGSSNSFNFNNLPSSSQSPSASSSNFNPYIVSAESRNLLTTGNGGGGNTGNKLADQQTSFSQNIVAKLADFSNINKKPVGDSVSAGSESFGSFLQAHVAESQGITGDKKLPITPKNVNAPTSQNPKNNDHKIPDMDTAASEIRLISPDLPDPVLNVVLDKSSKHTINFAKKLSAKVRRVKAGEDASIERGLKSGFYT